MTVMNEWRHTHAPLLFTFSHAYHFHDVCEFGHARPGVNPKAGRCVSRGKLWLINLPTSTHTHTHTHTHARTHSMPLRTEAGSCCRCQYKLRLITVPSHQHTSDRRWMREVSPLRGSHLQLHTGQRVSDPVRLRHHTRAVTRQDAAVMEPSKRVGVPCLLLSKSTRKCHAKPKKKQKAISSGEDWKRGTGPLFSKSSKSI